jgi:hypothetical protein
VVGAQGVDGDQEQVGGALRRLRPARGQADYLLTAIALVLVFFYSRVFAIQVQDRVIRLEERLRLARLLPDDLRGRVEEFTVAQLVALRFASDAELPGLARRVLQEGMGDRDSIKRAIKDWRADNQRA